MTPVEFHFVLPTGVPLVNLTVEIQLARSSFSDGLDGITMPRPITAQTDAQGKVTVALWPSTTLYYVSVQDSSSEATLSYKFLVPEVSVGTVVRLQDIVVNVAPLPVGGVQNSMVPSSVAAPSVNAVLAALLLKASQAVMDALTARVAALEAGGVASPIPVGSLSLANAGTLMFGTDYIVLS